MSLRFAALMLLQASLAAAASEPPVSRYVPMAGAPRAIYVPLGENLHVTFDTELLRTHLGWSGVGLQLNGTPHTGSKTPFLCGPIGQPFLSSVPLPGWQLSAGPPAVLKERPAHLQFLALQRSSQRPTFRYRVGTGNNGVTIDETPLPLPGYLNGFGRRFEVGPASETLWLQPLAEFVAVQNLRQLDRSTFAIQDTNGWLVIALTGGPENADIRTTTAPVELAYAQETEHGGESLLKQITQSGLFARTLISIPPHEQRVTFDVLVVRIAELPTDVSNIGTRLAAACEASWQNPVPKRTPAKIQPVIEDRRPRGDEAYAIESFPLPSMVDLQVTGMTWKADDTLAICTWTGDLWLVEHARGPVEHARFRRFASGLNEPLGIANVNGELVVAQKPELTRVRDLDRDGIADTYECINDDWAFTGNYHAFTFGPAVEADGSFVVGFCGQRARWDVDYASWLIRVSGDGSSIETLASGLRAPNGLGFHGSDHELFATDNQGNWIGACKLNHIQPGHSYGFRAARPAPLAAWENPSPDFTPPAVWFPRKLAPSAAGFATIPSTGFGPFAGQLLVADFQNANVVRVALEKVNGQWQGAVFPFLKGFGSGANRLVFDPEGRLYVGGVKNKAWASLGPFEGSLDRVTFTGETPFEVQHVRALPDGLELTFTTPVDREFAGDPESYFVSQFNYAHHETYGSPEFDHDGKPGSATTLTVTSAALNADGRKVQLQITGLQTGFVTRVVAALESAGGELLRSDEFYYTLNSLPQ